MRSGSSFLLLARLVGVLVFAGVVAGCGAKVSRIGNRLNPEIFSDLEPGVTLRSEVREALGPPSDRGLAEEDLRWYYIAWTAQQTAFFSPEVRELQVTELVFDDVGLLREVRELADGSRLDLRPASGETPTTGRTLSFWQQFFGNIGRFSAPAGGASTP